MNVSEFRSQTSSPSPPATLVAVAVLAMMASLYTAFLYAPTDSYQGDVQRLFYLHVPAALTMYVLVRRCEVCDR